eukprot:1384613-Alexandrium_andersonii.AAC.1
MLSAQPGLHGSQSMGTSVSFSFLRLPRGGLPAPRTPPPTGASGARRRRQLRESGGQWRPCGAAGAVLPHMQPWLK